MTPKWKYLLTSRKFWACIIGLVFIFIQAYKPDFPITEEQVLPIVLLLVSYILGVAIEARSRPL
jgi:hypothetical protein